MEIKKTGSWNEACHLLPSTFHTGALFRPSFKKKNGDSVVTELIMLSSASQQNHLLIIQTH
jgi:hypothetical protein